MPVGGGTNIPVTQQFSADATFPPQGVYGHSFTRLDCFSNGTDVVAQMIEAGDTATRGWVEDQNSELVLPMGFNSLPVETPFVAVRFKVWSQTQLATTGTIHIRLFG